MNSIDKLYKNKLISKNCKLCSNCKKNISNQDSSTKSNTINNTKINSYSIERKNTINSILEEKLLLVRNRTNNLLNKYNTTLMTIESSDILNN